MLIALVGNTLLSAESMNELTRDRTPNGTVIESSPQTANAYGEWHYALGCWRECATSPYTATCDEAGVVSSPGAFGFYPWFDQSTGYWGLIATQIRLRGSSITVPLGQSWYAQAKRAIELEANTK